MLVTTGVQETRDGVDSGLYVSAQHIHHVSQKQLRDFLFYRCQIADIFYKNYPVCTLENVLSSATKTFTHTIYILCKQLFNIKSKQNREPITVFN